MSVQEYAEKADMIVAGYAYLVHDGFIEVVDLNDLAKHAVIQNGDVVESLMSDEEDDTILKYRNPGARTRAGEAERSPAGRGTAGVSG